jgi:hypothetical protein
MTHHFWRNVMALPNPDQASGGADEPHINDAVTAEAVRFIGSTPILPGRRSTMAMG